MRSRCSLTTRCRSPTSLAQSNAHLIFYPCRYRTGVTLILRDTPKRFAGEGLRGHTTKSWKDHTPRHSAQHATFHLCTFFLLKFLVAVASHIFALQKKCSSLAQCHPHLPHAPQHTQDKRDRHQPGHGAHGHLPAQSPLHNAGLSGSPFTGYEPVKTMVSHSLEDNREAYVKKDIFSLPSHQPITTHLYPHPTNVGKNAMKVASQLLMQERDASDARWRVYRSSRKDSMYPAAGDLLRENLLLS